MKILALEFSSSHRSVAVAESNDAGFRLLGNATAQDARESTGMVLLETALQKAAALPPEIDVLAVGLGPGSYAGIRSGIAIAQGWQLGRETRLLGISSVEVLASEAQQKQIFGEIKIAIDAQRREF